jgi:hypothetical protein
MFDLCSAAAYAQDEGLKGIVHESLARGYAKHLIADARSRAARFNPASLKPPAVSGNAVGQKRWAKRMLGRVESVRIGRPIIRYGKPFRFGVPILRAVGDEADADPWPGIALGQFRVETDRQWVRWSWPTGLRVTQHALIRLGQRSDLVGLHPVAGALMAGLAWLPAHAAAAEATGSEDIWLPITQGRGGGLLLCRMDTHPGLVGDVPVVVTYIGTRRISEFKSRLLTALEMAQSTAPPAFPCFALPEADRCGTAVAARLIPIYDDLGRFALEDDFEMSPEAA